MFKELARKNLKVEGIEKWPKIKNEIIHIIQASESSELSGADRIMQLNLIRADELALIALVCKDVSVEHIEFCKLIDITKECLSTIGLGKENTDEDLLLVENTYLEHAFSAISIIANSMYLLNSTIEQNLKPNMQQNLQELDLVNEAFDGFILNELVEETIDSNPKYKEHFNKRDNLLTMRLASVKMQLMTKLDDAQEVTRERVFS